jgi:hypothetical protein
MEKSEAAVLIISTVLVSNNENVAPGANARVTALNTEIRTRKYFGNGRASEKP